MKSAAFKTEEKLAKKPILIVDKIGVVGKALSEEFSKDYLVFFATKRLPQDKNEKILYIPFSNKIPKVPDNNYEKIFIVDDGEVVTRESISSFIKKAKHTSSPIYFLGNIRNIDLEDSNEIIKSYDKAKVLIFGDLFDNDFIFDKKTSVTKFILESRRNKKIRVPGEGLSLNYPISFDDTIKLIVKAAYIDIPERAVLLFARHPITDISLANTFQKIDPEIDVDFEKEKDERNFYFPKNSQYALAAYDLKKKLLEIDLENKEGEAIDLGKGFELRFFKPVLFFLLACLFLLLLPLLTTYAYMFLGQAQLESAKKKAGKGEFENALKKTKNAEKLYSFAEQSAGPLEYQMEVIGQENFAKENLSKINTYRDLSMSGSSLLEGAISLKKLSEGKSGNSGTEIKNAVESFKKANLILQNLEASGQVPKEFDENIKNILPILSLVSDSSEVLPQVLGFDSEKTYLILFNDNMELRPAGGVIGLAEKIKIKNGKVTKLEDVDISALDEGLSSLVEAPYFLRRHLPTEKLLLRDSGSSPDFVTSAINTSSIYKLESEIDVDGVIGLNLGFAKKLLSATGPIEIGKSGIIVDSENIYEKALEFENENNGKDFFIEIINSIKSNINKNNNISFLGKVGESVKEKEIIFAFKDPELQSIFTANNLSGSLIDQREKSGSVSDYFGISESNLGKNKVNQNISRSVVRELSIDDDQLGSEVKISFKNNGEGNDSIYKNYMQIILPEGSKIQNVSVGGRKTDIIPAITDPSVYERNGFVSPEVLEVEERIEHGKSVFGFLILVPQQSVRVVSISYVLPFMLPDSEKNIKYSLIVYKQPGVESYPFSQTFNFPQNISVLPNTLISKEIRRDEQFNFLISPK